MREPRFQPGDIGRTMSRIPFGGFAVLDIARPTPPEEEGALSKKAVRFLNPRTDLNLTRNDQRNQGRQLCRLGLGDFGSALESRRINPFMKSACQIEAPFPRRTPILHRAAPIAASKSANRSAADLLSCPDPDHRLRGGFEGTDVRG